MRTKIGVALAGLTVAAGGAMIAGAAQAQTYYYNPPPAYYYNPPPSTYYAPAPRYVAPAYGAPSYYGAPAYSAPGLAGAVIGTILGADAFSTVPGVPVDRYGPDPNGMMAPDGHRIKCKLQNGWDSYRERYMTQRQCWEQ
jgi:hypothetical protein